MALGIGTTNLEVARVSMRGIRIATVVCAIASVASYTRSSGLRSVLVGNASTVFGLASSSSRAGVAGIVARTDIVLVSGETVVVMVMLLGSETTGSDSADFGITSSIVVLGLALPEAAAGRTGGIAVVGGRTITLLFLVVLDKTDLEKSSDGEEEAENDGASKYGSFKPASSSKVWHVGG